MRSIPYIIDNRKHQMVDVLNDILSDHEGRSLDIATAYFSISGYDLLRENMDMLGSFRLLIGSEVEKGSQVGLHDVNNVVKGLLTEELNSLPFNEQRLRMVEDFIKFLRRPEVGIRVYDNGFLHSKAYLFYNDLPKGVEDRLRPVACIVGSSNLTAPGLRRNRELNMSHQVNLQEARDGIKATAQFKVGKISPGAQAIQELDHWFAQHWQESKEFKKELIELLDSSKFGSKEYSPYQVYLKALYEYFGQDLEGAEPEQFKSAVDLAEFQDDAFKKAKNIITRYHGVMISDSVGLGKTWVGKRLLEEYAYKLRQKALVVCPASLRDMWEQELKEATISASIVSQEELGQEDFDYRKFGDVDVVLVDESHNFRNRTAQRYDNISALIKLNGGQGKAGYRKKIILMTATPINNDLFDLYNQLSLITQGNKGHFSAVGIGDLYKYFLQARRDFDKPEGRISLFNLLEEIVIRRTRGFIKENYPEAKINGKLVHFPERKLKTLRYDLESTYEGIYDEIFDGIENLKLAPYAIESYKLVSEDEFERGRGEALVGIFKSRFMKRFESSVEAFRISVHRSLEFLKSFREMVDSSQSEIRILRSKDFQKALRYIRDVEGGEDLDSPASRLADLDDSEDARKIIEGMETASKSEFEIDRLMADLGSDIETLEHIYKVLKQIDPDEDAKLQRLKQLLQEEFKAKKVLLFTYYKDTARYLYRQLGHPESESAKKFKEKLGGVTIRRIDGGSNARERRQIVSAFSPKSQGKEHWKSKETEIDILFSTDVLAEGQNLQDCGHLINYDLHWNPTRMIQRAGRIDRIGTDFEELLLGNMFPEEGLNKLLKLVETLNRKLTHIDQAGMLDASVLGEEVNPQNFNTIKRIEAEDGTVTKELEETIELVSSEALMAKLLDAMNTVTRDELDRIPDGIHSGMVTGKAKGIFYYFVAELSDKQKLHFWRYVDVNKNKVHVEDNKFVIGNLITCDKDTDRVVETDLYNQKFDLQEMAIEDILKSHQQQQALELAPTSLDRLQIAVLTILEDYMNHPKVNRSELMELRRFIKQPMLNVQIKLLRDLNKQFQQDSSIQNLLTSLKEMRTKYGLMQAEDGSEPELLKLTRDDLRLICFDVLCS